MTPAEITTLKSYCNNLSEDVQRLFQSVQLHFVICSPEEKSDEVATLVSKLNGHPAINQAFLILRPWIKTIKNSAFLGLAKGQEGIVFSFKTKTKILAFIAIDTSLYNDYDESIRVAHTLMAQFFETVSIYLKDYSPSNGSILQPKRNQVAQCRSNLKNDIYSSLQMIRDGSYEAHTHLAKQRTIETLTPQSEHRPEDYPFPIAIDILNYAIENQISSTISTRGTSQLVSQYQLATQIASCFEAENLHSWILFANSSQHMAWSGYTASQILGAAINTSTNPFIKSIGHLLAEITNLSPVEEDHLPQEYNPFLAEEINQIRHDRAIEETFEMAIIHAMEADSHLPIIRVANLQNEGLLKGKISGWCASALHAAAKAYIGAKGRGIPPLQAARLEFQSAKQQSNWQSLLHLGQYVVGLYRKSEAVTLNELAKWAALTPDAKFILDSLNLTIADPHYAHKLDTITAMPALAPAPEAVEEAPPEPEPLFSFSNYTPTAPVAAPALGLGGGVSGLHHLTHSLFFENDDDNLHTDTDKSKDKQDAKKGR